MAGPYGVRRRATSLRRHLGDDCRALACKRMPSDRSIFGGVKSATSAIERSRGGGGTSCNRAPDDGLTKEVDGGKSLLLAS